ncbi:MAG: GTP cyclohydrolase I FolE2 [Deltaproteobacteria bacterium]|jgi:GTP cyclohydrolase I|nr:GTP cyclohydrolase I FolE2 [Deltaproteobacteria bacterium]
MKDIQSQRDHRRINIQKVGVKDITYPVMVLDKAKRLQRTVANFNMYVNLPHRFKGTHMSRFIEILNQFHGEFDIKNLRLILEEMKMRLDAESAHLEIEFPYFVKQRPIHSNAIGIGEYQCKMHGVLDENYQLVLQINVPIVPLLHIQNGGGLPQFPGHWGNAVISIQYRNFIWIEDVIQMVEDVIGHRLNEEHQGGEDFPPTDHLSGESLLSVEKIAKAIGRKFSANSDILRFSISVENLSEGYKTFAVLDGPQEQTATA